MTYTLIFRSIIIYLLILILLRLMGKRQLGEMQPFELVITLIFADLATIPMAETALPLVHGIIPIITLSAMHFLLTFLIQKSLYFRKLINGKPIIVINPNGIDNYALKKLNITHNDLIENLRTCGYFNLEEVAYAIMQTNGTLSVLPKSQFAPATPEVLKIDVEKSSLPIILISDSKFVNENMTLAKLDQNYILNELQKHNLTLKQVALLTLNGLGNIYIQPLNNKCITCKINYKGDFW